MAPEAGIGTPFDSGKVVRTRQRSTGKSGHQFSRIVASLLDNIGRALLYFPRFSRIFEQRRASGLVPS